MPIHADADGGWERVAAELRACRESQQRAWGNIDNTTIGRYLAGELSGDERQQVEQALEARPELRKLTDLVRDVLADVEPQAAPAAPAAVRLAPEVTDRPRSQSALRRWWRHSAPLVSLATAACLLLALGLSLPRFGGPAAAPGAPALGGAVASRGDLPIYTTYFRPADALGDRPVSPAKAEVLARIEQMDRTVLALEKQGKRKEALVLAREYSDLARKSHLDQSPRYAYGLNRVCQLYLEEGDLARAEPSLQQALNVSKKALGPEHPVTLWARNSLAGVYQVALNAPDADRRVALTPAPPAPAAPPTRGGPHRPLLGAGHPGGVVAFSGAGGAEALPTAPPPAAPPPPRGEPGYSRLGAFHAAAAPVSPRAPYAVAWSPDGKAVARQARESAQAVRERLARLDPRQVRSEVVPVLTQSLEDATSSAERQTAARALGQLGPAARDAVPALASCLKVAHTPGERQALLLALSQIGPSARGAVKELEQVAREGKDPLADAVCRRLQGREGRIGVDDASACFSVRALRESARAIHALAARDGVELLVETAPAPEEDAKEADARLHEMGPRGVCVRIAREGPSVRVWATEALRRQGFRPEQLQQSLTERCRRDHYDAALTEAVRFVAAFERTKK